MFIATYNSYNVSGKYFFVMVFVSSEINTSLYIGTVACTNIYTNIQVHSKMNLIPMRYIGAEVYKFHCSRLYNSNVEGGNIKQYYILPTITTYKPPIRYMN